MKNNKKARVIAFYLPQYHPIPENDEWWGKGFTEWTNVAKAKPLFKGHYQPRIPADLGFYDLRLPEVREAQAELAREAEIEGFCYWHYWFGNGKRLLERPFNEVLESGKPDFPFCLAWANHTWSTRTWDAESQNKKETIIMEQLYPGVKDYTDHFFTVLPAFKDKRYITVDGKPLFVINAPLDFDAVIFIKLWRRLAIENGLSGIHFVGITNNASFREASKGNTGKYTIPDLNDAFIRYNATLKLGFDAVCSHGLTRAQILSHGRMKSIAVALFNKYFKLGIFRKHNQSLINKFLYVKEDSWENVYPTIIPNWDRSPRNKNAELYYNSTPDVFRDNIKTALNMIKDKKDEHQILFLKSWNEWGEGNYVEPDIKYGKQFIEVLKQELML